MRRAALIAFACVVAAGCGGDRRVDAVDLGGATTRDLVFVRGGAVAGIYALDFQTGRETLVALNGREPAWSPDGTRIAYTREEDRRPGLYNRLWIANADGSKSRRLVDEKAASPAWSPDGAKIAFVGRSGVDVVDAALGHVQELSLEPKVPLDVAWSPNGSEFAISGFDGIYAVPMNGSQPRRMTNGDLDGSPAWSPDGKRLLFDRSDGLQSGRRGVFVVDADGTHVHRLTGDFYDSEAAWSPDGSTIVFARNDSLEEPSAGSELYAIDADGGTPAQLTKNRVFDGSPAWRPAH
jgi:Tol biopolymer transport system component